MGPVKGTLDSFLGSKPPSPVEKCADCGAKISEKGPKYKLKIKGVEKPYCQKCAKARLRPAEKAESI